MRLCVVEPDGYGGLIHFSFELCQALVDAGHQVSLVTDRNYELDDKLHRFSVHKFLRLWNPVTVSVEEQRSLRARAMRGARRGFRAVKLSYEWARLTRYLLAHKPDAIIFSEILYPHLAIFLWVLKKRGMTLAQLCHEFAFQEREGSSLQLRAALSGSIYRQFDSIFFLSRAAQAAFLARYRYPSEHTACIPHGSQRSFPAAAIAPGVFREALGVDATDPIMLFFGTIRPSKGIEVLLEAFACLRNRGKAWLVVAGQPTRFADMGRLRALAAQFGISDRVIFRSGYIPMDQVASYFDVSRCIVLPYLSATQSGVLHLANQFARPVIATTVGGLAEDVRPGETGMLVPPSDPEKLAAAMDSMIEDPAMAERLGTQAAVVARSEPRWAKAASIITETLESVVTPRILRGLCISCLALALLAVHPIAAKAEDMADFQAAERALAAGDFTNARAMFAVLAERGEAVAQARLGTLYEKGQGGLRDEVEARRLYTLAAKAGNEAAMVALAHMLLDGRGGAADMPMGRSWLRSAIGEGNLEAKEDLAASLLDDKSGDIPADQAKEAIDLYISAANQGSTDAFDALTKIYAAGRFVPTDMGKSTYYLRMGAEAGDAWAMNDYADRLSVGVGEPKNLTRAREWYSRAAALGNPEAQYQLALIVADDPKGDPAKVNALLAAAAPKLKWAASELANRLSDGVGGIRNLEEADRLYTELAGQGLRAAHLWLGKAREEGLVGRKNPHEALSHYLAAAAMQDESWLSERIASFYEKGTGTPVDMATAAQWYLRAAGAGSIDAAAWLGDAYQDGRGVAVDAGRAADWAHRAAEGGDAWSMMNYAAALENGQGVAIDIPAALRWYEKAAQSGALEGELEAGRVLSDEDLGVFNLARAARWYEKATARGEPRGELELGRMLLFGTGVTRDEAKALRLITSGAEKGLPKAQFTLASLYFHGTEVPRNLERAYYWWKLAAAGGDPLAKARIAEIADSLSNAARKRLDAEAKAAHAKSTTAPHGRDGKVVKVIND